MPLTKKQEFLNDLSSLIIKHNVQSVLILYFIDDVFNNTVLSNNKLQEDMLFKLSDGIDEFLKQKSGL